MDTFLAVQEKYKRINVLINCAAVIKIGDIMSLDPKDFDRMFMVNLKAAMALTELFKEKLIESRGCIVNVSCDKGSRPEAG